MGSMPRGDMCLSRAPAIYIMWHMHRPMHRCALCVPHSILTVLKQCTAAYECACALQVGEHIPKAHTMTFLRNLDRHNAQGIILSWSNARAKVCVPPRLTPPG